VMMKNAVSMCTIGMAEEFKEQGLAVNGLWPKKTIGTAVIKNLLGGDEVLRRSRKPDIMADAAYLILKRDSRAGTGRFYLVNIL
jgi:citronellol/citronellal dehydrogenase